MTTGCLRLAAARTRVKAAIIGLMRYALLRPRLKRSVMRLLSLHPDLLMAMKRLGVRAGLAANMGQHHSLTVGAHIPKRARLSARATRIHDELERAISIGKRP